MPLSIRDEPADLQLALTEWLRAHNEIALAEGVADRAEQHRQYWSVVEVALHSTFRNLASAQKIDPGAFFDVINLIAQCQQWAGYLATGKVPEVMSGVASRGVSGTGPTERQHIRDAVAYRDAVRAGIIVDRSPNKTICDLFGVDKTTAAGWFRDYPPTPSRPSDTADTIRQRAEQSGTFYKTAGRSNGAVRRRSRAKAEGLID